MHDPLMTVFRWDVEIACWLCNEIDRIRKEDFTWEVVYNKSLEPFSSALNSDSKIGLKKNRTE